MRDIMFRGKRVDNGEWVYGYLCSARTICTISPMGNVDEYVVDPNTIGQYTGLQDKNGNKIFEGDIVLKRTYNGKKPFPVTFDSGMFHCGYGGGSSTATHGYTLDDRQIEVIGNIFDNPELMESRR